MKFRRILTGALIAAALPRWFLCRRVVPARTRYVPERPVVHDRWHRPTLRAGRSSRPRQEQGSGALGTPKAPSYFYNASADELAIPANVDELVAQYCARGLTVQSVTEPGDHATLVETGFPGAVSWIAGRFAGTPAPSTC